MGILDRLTSRKDDEINNLKQENIRLAELVNKLANDLTKTQEETRKQSNHFLGALLKIRDLAGVDDKEKALGYAWDTIRNSIGIQKGAIYRLTDGRWQVLREIGFENPAPAISLTENPILEAIVSRNQPLTVKQVQDDLKISQLKSYGNFRNVKFLIPFSSGKNVRGFIVVFKFAGNLFPEHNEVEFVRAFTAIMGLSIDYLDRVPETLATGSRRGGVDDSKTGTIETSVPMVIEAISNSGEKATDKFVSKKITESEVVGQEEYVEVKPPDLVIPSTPQVSPLEGTVEEKEEEKEAILDFDFKTLDEGLPVQTPTMGEVGSFRPDGEVFKDPSPAGARGEFFGDPTPATGEVGPAVETIVPVSESGVSHEKVATPVAENPAPCVSEAEVSAEKPKEPYFGEVFGDILAGGVTSGPSEEMPAGESISAALAPNSFSEIPVSDIAEIIPVAPLQNPEDLHHPGESVPPAHPGGMDFPSPGREGIPETVQVVQAVEKVELIPPENPREDFAEILKPIEADKFQLSETIPVSEAQIYPIKEDQPPQQFGMVAPVEARQWENAAQDGLVGVVILFLNLRGFAPLFNQLPPVRVVELLGKYFSSMTAIILGQQGTVEKMLGDTAMAIFHTGNSEGDPALRALNSSIRISRKLNRIIKDGPSRDSIPLSLGIGMHYREMIVEGYTKGELPSTISLEEGIRMAGKLSAMARSGEILFNKSLLESFQNLEGKVEVHEQVVLKGEGQPFSYCSYVPSDGSRDNESVSADRERSQSDLVDISPESLLEAALKSATEGKETPGGEPELSQGKTASKYDGPERSCPECGEILSRTASYCTSCGYRRA